MGCFGYECACGGRTCDNVGTQDFADEVVIEVPLKDGTNLYVRGVYDGSGNVFVNNVEFYLKQFEDYHLGWIESRIPTDREVYLANRIWTYEEDYWPDDDDRELVIKPGRISRMCFPDSGKSLATYSDIFRDNLILVDGGITQLDARRKRNETIMKQLREVKAAVAELKEACP